MYDKMLRLLRIRKKKSITATHNYYSDTASMHYPFQYHHNGSLVLPTSLDQVAAAAHRCAPTQLPGEDATEDDVRYFLYQILTLKEYEVVRSCPQWILETCIGWRGGGRQLRSLSLDGFQQLCPLNRGHANIDWTVRGSKFKLQEMPPCGTRDRICRAVKTVVTTLKAKETGHRGPGWQESTDMEKRMAFQSTERLTTQQLAPLVPPGFSVPCFSAASTAYPVQTPFYSFSNHSLPHFPSMPSLNIQQDQHFMHHRASSARLRYSPSIVESLRPSLSPGDDPPLSPEDRDCYQRPPPPVAPLHSPLLSPALSYAHSVGASSLISHSTRLSQSTQDSTSTAMTSPPISENEKNYWTRKIDQPHSTSQSNIDISPPDLFRDAVQRTSTGLPSRYRMKSSPRSFDPQLHMAQLRNPSYSTTALSQSPSTQEFNAIDEHGYRRDSAMLPEMSYRFIRGEPSFRPSSRSATTRTYEQTQQRRSGLTALANSRIICSRTSVVHPPKNDGVDAYAFETADQIGYNPRSGSVHFAMVNQRNKLKRGKSDNVLCSRVNDYGDGTRSKESTNISSWASNILRVKNV